MYLGCLVNLLSAKTHVLWNHTLLNRNILPSVLVIQNLNTFNPIIFSIFFWSSFCFPFLIVGNHLCSPLYCFLPGPYFLLFLSLLFMQVMVPWDSWFLWQRGHGLDKSRNQNYLGFSSSPQCCFKFLISPELRLTLQEWIEKRHEGNGVGNAHSGTGHSLFIPPPSSTQET